MGNVCIGPHAGSSLLIGDRNTLIGRYAGCDLTTQDNVTIIGDNIRNLEPKGAIILGIEEKVIIGKWLFSLPNPIYWYLKYHLIKENWRAR